MFQYKEGLLPAISCGTRLWYQGLRSFITYKWRVLYKDVLGREYIIKYISQFVKLFTWQTSTKFDSTVFILFHYFTDILPIDFEIPEIKRKLLESDTDVYGFAITTKKVNSKKDSNMESRSFVQLNYGKKSYMCSLKLKLSCTEIYTLQCIYN